MALDRFSAQAADYARYRIGYPTALYDWLLPQVTGCEHAWDCATGKHLWAGVAVLDGLVFAGAATAATLLVG